MLGRVRRTTRLDVGLALTLTGISFLVWAFVAGTSRTIMHHLIRDAAGSKMTLPALTTSVKLFFVDTGFVIDLVGLGWMVLGLILVFFASRQKISISWAWLAAVLQALMAALGAVLVGVACYYPYHQFVVVSPSGALETISQISLPVVIGFAILFWLVFLVGMLVDRARLSRRGPTITDGLRTNR